MNAQEIRIGNLLFRNKLVVTADGLTIHDLAFFPDSIGKQYSPIPLTPEWLERMGFKYSNDLRCFYTGNYSLKETVTGRFHFCQGIAELSTLEYVHQLQNLYFALTGTELSINP